MKGWLKDEGVVASGRNALDSETNSTSIFWIVLVQKMSDSANLLPLMDQVVSENGIELLSAKNDNYGGVLVEMKEPMDSEIFLSMLGASMSQWRQQGKKGVWLKLPIGLVNLVEVAVKEGFWYHHAEQSFLMLVYWIPKTVCTIPANASHRVGIGAIVVTDKREILVVQERSGRFQGTGIWKIPTGVVDEGEDISMAAVREVKEETGVDAEFVEILAFRQTHKSFFGKSDLFFLCFLRPLSFDIQKQEEEIEAAGWMQLEEYAAQPSAQKHGLFKYTTDLCLAKIDKDYAGFTPQLTGTVRRDELQCLYLNNRGLSGFVNEGEHSVAGSEHV
ncbi:hypothetical protein Nepgr_007654 [Nepenthes gracilis]|uniref:Nudix hydrolase domain-containing protein n=1 Tax=Nepenthes gracilis TaxID=150966 RepID=A0AAD3S7N5_NEPGR|nr:hypothetical protein Nepgr_007654 [Nepenthes gracilis]